MRFIELFAGIGGFRLGLEKSGHKCVYANEWLKKPASIYERVFNEKPDGRDIRHIRGNELPQHELIVGGFPCATFSVAGKKTGFGLSDARGTLCFEMFRLISECRTPYVLFENTKGLLNHNNGKSFAVIITALDEMGYDCQWEVLDSKNFCVPQSRERLFLVANTREVSRPEIFPIKRPNTKDAEMETKGKKENGNKVKMSFLSHTTSNMKQRTQMRSEVWTLDASPQNKMVVHTDEGIRRLTPIECERLQGLPDNHTKYYSNGDLVSDTERYERCGRTVTTTIIKAIGDKLLMV